MSEYREKFLEAEKKASNLVEQLEELKKESVNYKYATGSLNDANERISELTNKFSLVVSEEQNLIKTIKQIGAETIIDAIEQSQKSFEEKINSQNLQISKLFIFVYITIGLIVIAGTLVVIFR